MSHGTFCFMDFYGYGWYLSSTAALLYTSWQVHNLVAWIKIKPFLNPLASKIYIWTVVAVTPLIILQIFDNFRYFNNISELYLKIRPYEPLFRDPWWIFTCCYLLYMVRTRYSFPLLSLLHRCPRFTVMLLSMALSIIFIALDVTSSVVPSFNGRDVVGINPYWKIQLVFKCFADTVILDDFRTALERLRKYVFNDDVTIQTNSGTIGEAGGFGEDSGGVVPNSGDENSIEARKRRVQRRGGSIFDGPGFRTRSPANTYEDPSGQRSRASAAREAIGRVGMKISRLPMLGGADKTATITSGEKSSGSSTTSTTNTNGDEKPSSRHVEKQRRQERERQRQREQQMEEIQPQPNSSGQMSFEDFLRSDQSHFISEKNH
ncbi:MAG: hypothetical protein Q9227_008090 [Pyrenula ochraceoflavens]